MASVPMPGARCAAASGSSRSGYARLSSRPCNGWAPSWSTKSTSRATSKARRRGITRVMLRRRALLVARLVLFVDHDGAQPLPPVEIVDLRSAPRVPSAEAGAIPWSETLDQAISGALERGEQVFLLLNRRGFATFVQCPA